MPTAATFYKVEKRSRDGLQVRADALRTVVQWPEAAGRRLSLAVSSKEFPMPHFKRQWIVRQRQEDLAKYLTPRPMLVGPHKATFAMRYRPSLRHHLTLVLTTSD